MYEVGQKQFTKENYLYNVSPTKYAFILICFCFIGLNESVAQLYGAVKVTYSLPFIRSQKVKYDDHLDFLLYKVRFIEQDVSPTISAFAYFRNELLYLEGGIGYRRVRSKFSSIDYLNYEDLTPQLETKETNYFVIPITTGIRFENFKFGFGPVVSIIASENKIFENLQFFEERRDNVEYGFSINAGLALYRLHIDISYEYQFNGVGDYFYFRGDRKGFTNQSRFVNIGLGYLF